MAALNPRSGVARLTRSEALARRLEEEITTLGLKPGYRVGSKADLRTRFQVAPATISESLRILEGHGLVTTRPGPGGGIFVASPSSRVRFRGMVLGFKVEDAPYSDCLVIRNALEPLVCRDAMKHCRPRDARDLRSIVGAMGLATKDAAEFLRIDWRLHRRITEVGQNAPLKSLYLTLLDFVENGLEDALPSEAYNPSQSVTVHQELIEAIITGNESDLKAAVERHTPSVGA